MTSDREPTRLRIAAVADIHYPYATDASTMPALVSAAEQADVLLICGDLTHHGLVEEAVELAKLLSRIPIPILAVLGNHDFHSDQQEEIKRALKDSTIRVLDGDGVEIRGVGFAGVKGFGSGFGRRVIEPWGESIMKQFVREAVEESLKLGAALAQLRAERRIALLHYAPIVETVEGEPLETTSFWVRRVHMVQQYRKVDGFWLAAASETDADVRLFGPAHLTIDYQEYQVNRSMMARREREQADSARRP
jgi:Icc-related predicted phosphoesterase